MTLATPCSRVVLVIEDDAPLRGLLAELLTDAGYVVLTAADGTVGLWLAQEHRPHVILLDLVLPSASRPDVLSTLRSCESTRYIPVVAITCQPPSTVASLLSKPNSLLQMPFDVDELLLHLDRMAALSIEDRDQRSVR